MVLIISDETISPFDSPKNTSESTIASSSVSRTVSVAKNCFCSSRFSLLVVITPLLSTMSIFAFLAPKAKYNLAQETAAAPAPLMTIFASSIFLSANERAFIKAAEEIIAVPC